MPFSVQECPKFAPCRYLYYLDSRSYASTAVLCSLASLNQIQELVLDSWSF